MRAYFFGNMYLSSIQQGIQAAHVVHELYNKYSHTGSQQFSILDTWARDHKTMVLLNAGYGDEIRALIKIFEDIDNPLPWARFNEGQDSLDGALTCVGIILPEEFYEAAKEVREMGFVDAHLTGPNYKKLQTDWERGFALRLNNYGLAR